MKKHLMSVGTRGPDLGNKQKNNLIAEKSWASDFLYGAIAVVSIAVVVFGFLFAFLLLEAWVTR